VIEIIIKTEEMIIQKRGKVYFLVILNNFKLAPIKTMTLIIKREM
jgi:hypothetical protein